MLDVGIVAFFVLLVVATRYLMRLVIQENVANETAFQELAKQNDLLRHQNEVLATQLALSRHHNRRSP